MSVITSLKNKAMIGWKLLLAKFPDRLTHRLLPKEQRFTLTDVPGPIAPPHAPLRLLIAPVNFAGQGYTWARAVDSLPGVAAKNMQYRDGGDLGFPADYSVSKAVFAGSGSWARAQRDAVGKGFSHVLIEAERPIFGNAFDGFVEREVRYLQHRGVTVGAISHGTDLRLPSRHAQLDEWSPFKDMSQPWITPLEAKARANQALLRRLEIPVFVSTPELLLDWPQATWLPIVVQPERWQTITPVLQGPVPVVVHAPTNPLVKGTAQILPVVESLSAAGMIAYRGLTAVAAAQMPEVYAGSDIVLEQFALGMYSVTAVEAMAAGRLVIGHVHEQVRDHVRVTTGRSVPVVEATPDTLRDTLQDIAHRPDHYRDIAAQGPDFVRVVHDGRVSAQVLARFLGDDSAEA